MKHYWNHNTAFHKEIVDDAAQRGGRVLDIGCGDGLLVERLAPIAQEVVGIDLDHIIIEQAKQRLNHLSNVTFKVEDFVQAPTQTEDSKFATIISVATLHHMEMETALVKMKQRLESGGKIIIVGLAENKSIVDYIISGLLLIPIRLFDKLHGGVGGSNVKIADPKESLAEIREVVQRVLPGAKVRRRFYYRYSITWSKPKIIG